MKALKAVAVMVIVLERFPKALPFSCVQLEKVPFLAMS